MPYVPCPRCNLRSYTAARYAGTDECPACGGPLSPTSAARRRASLELVMSQAKRLGGHQTRPRDML